MEEDLEELLEEESRQKEQEDSQVVQQLYEENGRELDEYWTELVGDQKEEEELEALLEQELEQKQAEDEQNQLSVSTSNSKETGFSSVESTFTDSSSSVAFRVFQVEKFSAKPYLTKAEHDWREDPQQPPLALQWTQKEFDLFCQQLVRLGPSALEHPWLLAKAVQSKNALECLILYEAIRHGQYEVKLKLHPNRFVVRKASDQVKNKSKEYSLPSLTWEKLVWRYKFLVASRVKRGFFTPPELKCYEPWSIGFWLRLSVQERRLLALADWHILLSYCNSLRPCDCPPVIGADPRVLVRVLHYTCDYMRYITRVALSFAISKSKAKSPFASIEMDMDDVSQAIDIANEYYRYRGGYRFYLGTEWMSQSTRKRRPSYYILEKNIDESLPLDRFYDIVLLDYGWLDGNKHYVCIPKSLKVEPITDLYFHEEWWHPQQNPTFKSLSSHLLVRKLVDNWITLWLGEEIVSEAEWKQSYESCASPLNILENNSCEVSSLCRQWICNAGCYYLAYQCRHLMKNSTLIHDSTNQPFDNNGTTESNGIYFDYIHWHALQTHLEEHIWN